METAGFRCPVGFMEYAGDLSGSTEILTPAATRSGSEDGRKPRPRCLQTMEANESTPCEGESAVGESFERQAELAHARGVAQQAGDLLVGSDVRNPDREQLMQRIQEARADLHVAEKILAEGEA
jgi:hypothetical protein